MNNKNFLQSEAERLFIYEMYSITGIAKRLNISRNTVIKWKEQNDWSNKKRDFLKSKQCFHEEMYEFARKLMRDIQTDIENGEKPDQARLFTFCKLIPMFTKVKNYEDLTNEHKKEKKPKGLTPELIEQIEREVLGITPNGGKDTE